MNALLAIVGDEVVKVHIVNRFWHYKGQYNRAKQGDKRAVIASAFNRSGLVKCKLYQH